MTKAPDTLNLPAVQDKIKSSKRCGKEDCKAKLALSDFDCRCGKRFCGKHRQCEQHDCTFDFQKNGKDQLTKQLVKCDGERLQERV